MHLTTLRVDAGEHAFDGAILAARIHRLQDDQHRAPVASPGQADYVLFLGRAVPSKGVVAFAAVAEAWQRAHGTALRFVAVGQGTDRLVDPPPGVEWRPAVHTTAERAALLAGARCVVVPTETHEPWACVSVEAQCMGTPVLASPSGGLCENVKHGRSGFHCRTLGDWLAGIAAVGRLDRARIAARAWRRWGTDAVAPGLLAALLEARDAHVGAGWQTPTTRYPSPGARSKVWAIFLTATGLPTTKTDVWKSPRERFLAITFRQIQRLAISAVRPTGNAKAR